MAREHERVLQLPVDFAPTHETAGLPGFPAVDLFAPAGTRVLVNFRGTVRKLSGRKLSGAERPGGAYGYSFYVRNGGNGRERYVTHLGTRSVKLGQQIEPGSFVGTVAVPPLGSRPGSAHVHLGKHFP